MREAIPYNEVSRHSLTKVLHAARRERTAGREQTAATIAPSKTLSVQIWTFRCGLNRPGFAGGISLYEQAFMNRFDESVEEMLAHVDELGGPKSYGNYPAGWGWAMDAPFQYYKQTASHLGGVRNDLVISWPARIKDVGKVRTQFHFVSDIVPTILEATGMPTPETLDGVEQKPLDGISMVYTFDNAKMPSRRRTQVFETMQNLAIYHDGWWANTTPLEAPWDFFKKDQKTGGDNREWQLYNLRSDYVQAVDLSKRYPAKLQEMQKLFWSEAKINNILPIHAPWEEPKGRPSALPAGKSISFKGPMSRLPTTAAPNVVGTSFTIDADLDLDRDQARGVIVTDGGLFGGYALYLDKGVPVFHYTHSAQSSMRCALVSPSRPAVTGCGSTSRLQSRWPDRAASSGWPSMEHIALRSTPTGQSPPAIRFVKGWISDRIH